MYFLQKAAYLCQNSLVIHAVLLMLCAVIAGKALMTSLLQVPSIITQANKVKVTETSAYVSEASWYAKAESGRTIAPSAFSG